MSTHQDLLTRHLTTWKSAGYAGVEPDKWIAFDSIKTALGDVNAVPADFYSSRTLAQLLRASPFNLTSKVINGKTLWFVPDIT